MYLISSGDGSERGGWDITGTLVFFWGGGEGGKDGVEVTRGMADMIT